MRTALMIGCGIQEQLAVEVVERQGINCLTTDRNPGRNPTLVVDGNDSRGIVDAVSNCDGVFTFTEMVESVAEVADMLGLLGVNPISARYCQHKIEAVKLWTLAGVSIPKFKVFEHSFDVGLLQPDVSCGGQGIVELTGGRYLIREKINGTHHDVNGLFYENEFIPLGISDRFFDRYYREVEIRIPSVLTEDQQTTLYRLVEDGARALGITWGPVKADAVFDGEKFYLLEMAPRLHGPRCSLMAFPASGFEPLIPAIHVIVGDEPVNYEVKCDYCVIGRTSVPFSMNYEPLADLFHYRSYRLTGILSDRLPLHHLCFDIWHGDSFEELEG